MRQVWGAPEWGPGSTPGPLGPQEARQMSGRGQLGYRAGLEGAGCHWPGGVPGGATPLWDQNPPLQSPLGSSTQNPQFLTAGPREVGTCPLHPQGPQLGPRLALWEESPGPEAAGLPQPHCLCHHPLRPAVQCGGLQGGRWGPGQGQKPQSQGSGHSGWWGWPPPLSCPLGSHGCSPLSPQPQSLPGRAQSPAGWPQSPGQQHSVPTPPPCPQSLGPGLPGAVEMGPGQGEPAPLR